MPGEPDKDQPGGPYGERLQYDPVAARLPEKVANGVFCTGAIVIEGPDEFIVDFVQAMGHPPRLGARVIMSHRVMGEYVNALRENLSRYEKSFGPPKPLPPPPPHRRSVQEIYDELKLPDEQLCGGYATTVFIGHSPADFMMDFITRFYPRAAVAARVYLSASQVPRVLETLTTSYQNFQRKRGRLGGPGGARGFESGPVVGPDQPLNPL
jgi:hypothetical protein